LLSSADLARACHEAGVLHGTTPRHVEEILSHRPTTPGARQLRKVMHGEVHVTLSAMERRFLERLDEAGLPRPVTNKPAGGKRVDCRWADHRLTVELDSYRFHNSRHAWEQDRRRERQAHARGDDFRRYTRDDIFEQPQPMLGELSALLRVAAE
jgi:very-short-patch-repair endonuclease